MRAYWLPVVLLVLVGVLFIGILIPTQVYMTGYKEAVFGKIVDALFSAAFWTAVATIAIAWFTLSLRNATAEQGRLTQQSIDLARDEFISTHRPKLRVRDVVLRHSLPPGVQPSDLIERGQPIVGQLHIENFGTTPAEITESHCIVFMTGEGGLPMEPPYAREPANNFAGSAILEPGVPEPFNFRSAFTIGDEAEQFARGFQSATVGAHLYVMGWIRYQDRRQLTRRIVFCRLWRVSEGELHPRFHIVNDPDYEHED